jgi:predicted dehydrogenase
MATPAPLRFAVVGSSGFATGMAAPAVIASPDAELAGVLGSTRERGEAAARALGAGRGFASLDELLADDAVDAVWVAAHDRLHAPFGVACLDAGKHVIVEKPMATSVAEAQSLVDAEQRNAAVLRVGTHQRYRRVYQDIRDAIPSLGQLGVARLHFFVPFPPERMPGNWRATLDGSGGSWATKEFGAHLVDLLLWWTGPATLAGSVVTTLVHDVETDDTGVLLLRLANGGIGIVEVSGAMHGWTHDVDLYGTEGWLRAHDVWRGGGFVERSTGEDVVHRSDGARRDYPGDDPLDPYLAQLEDFRSAVGGGPSLGATGPEGLAALDLLLQAVAGRD